MGNLARRYGLDQAPPDPKLKGNTAVASVLPPPRKVAPVEAPKAEKIAKARKAVAETKGRPALSNTPKSNTAVSNTAAFDKKAYQRELMRKRRAEQKAKA